MLQNIEVKLTYGSVPLKNRDKVSRKHPLNQLLAVEFSLNLLIVEKICSVRTASSSYRHETIGTAPPLR